MVYCTILSKDDIVRSRRIISGRTWKKVVVTYSEILCRYFSQRRKTTKNLTQDSRCLGRDSKQVPPIYEAEALQFRTNLLKEFRYNGSPHINRYANKILVSSVLQFTFETMLNAAHYFTKHNKNFSDRAVTLQPRRNFATYDVYQCVQQPDTKPNHVGETLKKIPYILESNPHPFYSFRGLKNQMRIRFAVESWILGKW
jgi:hypothetical protein